MKVFIFGKNGMLGRYMYSWFDNKEYDVVGFERADLDILHASLVDVDMLLLKEGFKSGDVVINCTGLIKQRGNTSKFDFILVNSVFPHILQQVCEANGAEYIHITTDCVFDGLKGSYTEADVHNATDIYGVTKSLGEPDKATVIRTSIIGEELTNFSSLLEWVKANKGKEVRGYLNHVWNGVTCLQLAKICENIIHSKSYWNGVKHVFSLSPINKFNLVQLISEIYDLNITVKPYKTETMCDRSIATVYCPFVVPSLREQLVEMKEFYSKLITV